MEEKYADTDYFLEELCDPENINKGLRIASRILEINNEEDITIPHILIAVTALEFFIEKQFNDAFAEPGVFDYIFESARAAIKEIDKRRL